MWNRTDQELLENAEKKETLSLELIPTIAAPKRKSTVITRPSPILAPRARNSRLSRKCLRLPHACRSGLSGAGTLNSPNGSVSSSSPPGGSGGGGGGLGYIQLYRSTIDQLIPDVACSALLKIDPNS